VLCWEEHTITQILTALGLESRWRVLEHLAERGAWDREAVERQTQQLIEQEQPARWGRYHPVAVDDTTRHRTSKQVWGTCTLSGCNRARSQLGGQGRSAAGPSLCAGATGRSFHSSCLPWRNWKKSRSPLAPPATSQEGPLTILETTV
jgi:hypothetical protein